MSNVTIFTRPKVTLLAEQVFHNPLAGEWDTDAPSGGEALAEFAGRLCYLSFGPDAQGLSGGHKTIKGRVGNAPYLENIVTVKHGSVLEHIVHSVLIEQVSRSLTHELVRHRAGLAVSQLSQRYVDESQVAFVRPPELARYATWTPHPSKNPLTVFELACEDALASYNRMLALLTHDLEGEDEAATMKKKRARQAARAALPNAAETKLVLTGNARAWRHVMEMRGSPAADMEIRALAVALARTLKEAAPNVYADVEIIILPDGTEGVVVQHSKV